jgi:hypothetical protein
MIKYRVWAKSVKKRGSYGRLNVFDHGREKRDRRDFHVFKSNLFFKYNSHGGFLIFSYNYV